MDALASLAAILVGFLLRIGIPVAVTAFLAWILRRLDARWQIEAEQQAQAFTPHAGEGSEVRIATETRPCWEVRECPRKIRQSCPAYARPEIPCWQVFRDQNGRLREPCLTCEVFRDAPVPVIS